MTNWPTSLSGWSDLLMPGIMDVAGKAAHRTGVQVDLYLALSASGDELFIHGLRAGRDIEPWSLGRLSNMADGHHAIELLSDRLRSYANYVADSPDYEMTGISLHSVALQPQQIYQIVQET